MRFLLLAAIHLSTLCATGHAQEIFNTTGGKHPEHLVPPKHGSTEEAALFHGSREIGYYFREPSFKPPASLWFESVESKPKALDPFGESDEKPGPMVHTATVMEVNINPRLISDLDLVRTRYTAEIDGEMITRISRVWTLLLLQTANPRTILGGLDGTNHYFSVEIEGGGILHGATWSPPDKSLPGQFVAFAEKFISMVKSDKKITPEEREALMADLAALDAKLTARETTMEKMDSRE